MVDFQRSTRKYVSQLLLSRYKRRTVATESVAEVLFTEGTGRMYGKDRRAKRDAMIRDSLCSSGL